MKRTPILGILPLLSFSLLLAAGANADPLDLTDSPLVVSAAVDPNIMISFDTSGSMRDIVPDSPYDSATATQFNCSSRYRVPTRSHVYLGVTSSGNAYIQYHDGRDWRYNYWGTNSSSYRCFNDSSEYSATLNTRGFGAKYTGRYLNWYFSNDAGTGQAYFGPGEIKRPGTSTRMETSKAVAKVLLDANTGLNNARVGIAGFKNNTCRGCTDDGQILRGLIDIDDSGNRTKLNAAVDSLVADGSTPLASTLAQIGRYFVEGSNQKLSLSSEDAVNYLNSQGHDTKGYSLFSHQPTYANASDKPTASDQAISLSCQKSYVIMMTDGEPTSDQNYSGALARWGDNGENTSSAFDDVAAALHDTDLRPDFGTDHNNVSTYIVGFNIENDLLKNTAKIGGGEFFQAKSAAELTSALLTATNKLKAQAGSIASVAFNSSRLGTDSTVFQAKFDTDGWSGSLAAFPLSETGEIEPVAWNAADKLDQQSTSSRNIFTYNEDINDGVEFTFDNLSASQKADLYAGIDADNDGDSLVLNGINDDDDAKLLLDYLRGDHSNEGTGATDYRTRVRRLGDIVNSTPVFVGPPELNWPDSGDNAKFGNASNNYSSYKSGNAKNREHMLYVGSNDGMLHGFNAENSSVDAGKEKFAYIPGAIASSRRDAGLHFLANNGYSHRFYVDLTPTVSDVYITNGVSTDWRTVLVGGLRAGGKALFALDVTDPTKFTDPDKNADDIVLWEFSDADDPDFGYSYSQPSIVMMPNGKWAAVVGNGYNNSGDGHAKLFILYLEGGIDGTWSIGDYVEIDTGVGSTGTPNGLSTPRVVDMDGDSVADRVYAGDLQGNMWVFDLSNSSSSQWKVAYKMGSTPKPVFTAINDKGQVQPITTAPVLAKNPHITTTASTAPNVLVLFGTGKFLEPTDVTSNLDVMSYYAVADVNSAGKTRSNLARRELITTSASGEKLRTVKGDPVDWTTQYGWFMDLEDQTNAAGTGIPQGERIISEPLLRRSVLFFNTVIPSGTECSSGGVSWLMDLAFDTGLAPPDAVFDANKDGKIDTLDQPYVASKFESGLASKSGILGEIQYTPSSDGSIETRTVKPGGDKKVGSLSWEQIFRN